jgi:predicted dehydrogenase
MLTADFGYRTAFDARSRIFDPALGGGALLDVGVYPVSLAHMVLGTPSRITALAHLGESGIDEQSAAVLGYENGQLAILTAAVRTETPHEACLMGSRGWIRIHRPWWRPTRMTITRGDAIVDEIERPFEGNGYNCEAAEVMSCLRAGQLESAIMPLEESLAVMRTLDEIRQQFGLRYPMESDSPRR